MADLNLPRVKLPDFIPRKPVVPGPNSWAQQKQQRNAIAGDQIDDDRPNNRDRFEHKPMPPPPSGDFESHDLYLQPKTYIQPAVPLFNLPPNKKDQKNRAVTDPVAPKPLFAGGKVGITQLRKKYSQSKVKGEPPKGDLEDKCQSSPVIQVAPAKAAQVLGLCPVPDNCCNTLPSSAPAEPAPKPFRASHETCQERTATPARQVQSSPVPTRRYLRENGLPDPPTAEVSNTSLHQAIDYAQNHLNEEKKAEDITPTTPVNGFLHPPRIGNHTNIGEVGIVDHAGMHRVESFRGVIENVPTSNGSSGQMYVDSIAYSSQSSTARGQDTGALLPPNVYSPGNYGGVWENDPAVGYSLPPFSPMPRHPPHNPSFNTNASSYHNINRQSHYQHPLPSANSWASESQANSLVSTNPPLSALLPPRWPHHENSNSVPSPPRNQQDFERSGSTSAALVQIELTLHHHIDSSFGSLSRLITDKHDRAMDQTLRHLENLEDMVSKGFRELRNEIEDIKKQVGNLQGDSKDIKKRNDRTVELIKGLDGKLQALEKDIEEYACKGQQDTTSPVDHSTSEPESDRHNRTTSHRRTESAHAAVGQGESRQHYRGSANRTSNSARVSGTSSRRDRSNTLSSQPASRTSDERSTRREYFAELGAARGPVPDIRDHPAYSGMQQVQGQGYGSGHDQNGMPMTLNGLPYENPSLSDGRWYQQAYGNNR